MAVRNNLVGEKFGRLRVLRQTNDVILKSGRKKTAYICQCECGNEKVVTAEKLRSGSTKSCGCLSAERARESIRSAAEIGYKNKKSAREDMVGKRFGEVTIISVAGKNKHGQYLVHCKCDCGCEFDSALNHIRERGIMRCRKCQEKFLLKTFSDNELVDGTALCSLTQKIRSDNTSGVKGVYVNKRNGKFVAEIKLCGKKYWLGEYFSIEEARKAREMAEEKLFDPILSTNNRKTTGECRNNPQDGGNEAEEGEESEDEID